MVHEAQRTGPPIYALHLVSWLSAHTDLDISIVLLEGGPLVEEFGTRCSTSTITVAAADDPNATRQLLEEADVVYVNTAVSIAGLTAARALPRTVVSHVHELDIGLRHYLAPDLHDALMDLTDRFVVGPQVARDNLVERHGVDPERIDRVPYFVPPQPDAAALSPDPRHETGIDPASFVVGGCGTRDWRKAPDLFVHLAWELQRRPLPTSVRSVWVGSAIPTEPHWDERTELALCGLTGEVAFFPHQALPQQWMAVYDVFALTSREDCFPLVCLEAGALGVPIVCFDNGGIPELLADCDGGIVVPYPDVNAMADAVERLARDHELRRAMGARLRGHVLAHHQIDRIGSQIEAVIRRAAA